MPVLIPLEIRVFFLHFLGTNRGLIRVGSENESVPDTVENPWPRRNPNEAIAESCKKREREKEKNMRQKVRGISRKVLSEVEKERSVRVRGDGFRIGEAEGYPCFVRKFPQRWLVTDPEPNSFSVDYGQSSHLEGEIFACSLEFLEKCISNFSHHVVKIPGTTNRHRTTVGSLMRSII
ncbi:unnamed protein product [Sphenostylis stenocarpa]|uniref:Uncharacterized protein n=1 Tax=Sphenostylis stenocarpa TaxID=92480 RepID=A0AA86VE61_9FABA|nr:unnamed protein product [Sphenostylis stenocarpa]